MLVLRKIAPGIYLTLVAACLLLMGRSALGWLGDRIGGPFAYAYDDLRFNQAVWLTPPDAHGNSQRGRMADDVIQHRLPRRKPFSEVKQLLGEPEFWEKPQTFAHVKSGARVARIACYRLGAWDWPAADDNILAIRLDVNNCVIDAWHYQT